MQEDGLAEMRFLEEAKGSDTSAVVPQLDSEQVSESPVRMLQPRLMHLTWLSLDFQL